MLFHRCQHAQVTLYPAVVVVGDVILNHLHKLPRVVYTLTLDPASKTIGIANEQEQITYEWKKVFHAYRGKSATYLYATPARAFILPHYYIEGGANALWQIIDKKLPAEKTSHG